MGLCPLKCTFGRNSGIVGLLWCFQMAGYMGLLGLACSWIPRREIEPQLLVTPSVSSEACPHCIYHWLTLPGGKGGGYLKKGNQGFTLGKCVKLCWECKSFSKGQVQSLYPVRTLDKFFLAYENVMGSGNILLKETVIPHLWNTLSWFVQMDA